MNMASFEYELRTQQRMVFELVFFFKRGSCGIPGLLVSHICFALGEMIGGTHRVRLVGKNLRQTKMGRPANCNAYQFDPLPQSKQQARTHRNISKPPTSGKHEQTPKNKPFSWATGKHKQYTKPQQTNRKTHRKFNIYQDKRPVTTPTNNPSKHQEDARSPGKYIPKSLTKQYDWEDQHKLKQKTGWRHIIAAGHPSSSFPSPENWERRSQFTEEIFLERRSNPS